MTAPNQTTNSDRPLFADSSSANLLIKDFVIAAIAKKAGIRRAMIRVAFVGQAGAAAGGAERTLATHLAYAAADLYPIAILFEEGRFADELRQLAIPVEIVQAPASIAASRRDRLHIAAAFESLGHATRLAKRLKRLHIDVVYSNTMKANFVCGLAARVAGIPCVMHFHDIVDGLMLQALRFAARFGSVERIACARAVADSLRLKRTTVSYGPILLDSYHTLPEREDARDRLGLPTDLPVVALIGRINRWKGHDRLLRIAAEVNRVTPVHFAIVGAPIFRDADFVPELEALVVRLGLEKRISFLPWIEDTRVIYAAIDVNVNCSTREPFGRSVAEAAAAGVPSVCFDDSGAAETILNGCTGRIVRAGDEAAFALAILECIIFASDPLTRALIRHSAKRFDARVIAEEIADVVRRAAHLEATRSNAKVVGATAK